MAEKKGKKKAEEKQAEADTSENIPANRTVKTSKKWRGEQITLPPIK